HFCWRDPWTPGGHYPIDLLSGSGALRRHLDAGLPIRDLLESWQDPPPEFMEQRAACLIYPR
ncbi:MAG: hypothetical protein JXN59_00910, partial [Anaerolineae bacterium]|nr:hypothetical protein [Anaerolineae bacterium]